MSVLIEKHKRCYKVYVENQYAGRCKFTVSYIDQIVWIANLEINHWQRNKGLGTLLLYSLLEDIYNKFHSLHFATPNRNSIKHVRLNDGSQRYKKKHNIYKNIGLFYKKDWLMEGNIRHVLYGMKRKKQQFMTRFENIEIKFVIDD